MCYQVNGAYSFNFVTLFEGLSPFTHPLVGDGALGLEPHTLHFV